jgi:ABC-2 type transport system permease protein
MLAKAATILQKDFLTTVRYRNGLFLSAFGPLMQLLLSYYLARAIGPQFRPEGMSYFTFLLIGTGLFMFLHGCMHGFLNAIQEAQRTGTLEVLMTTATSPVALLFLAALSAIGTAFVQFLLYLGAGLVLFAGVIHMNAIGAVAVLVPSVLIAISFGSLAAGLQVSVQKGSVILWLFGSTAWVLAGTLFPVGALPKPVLMISQLVPLTHSLTGMRLAVTGGPGLSYEIAILSLCAIVLLPVSLGFFSWTVSRARRLGTLSFY